MDEIISEEVHESVIEPATEETSGETVEQLEDRLIAALQNCEESNRELRSRIEALERSHASRTIPEPHDTNASSGSGTGTPRATDTAPKPSHIWFRSIGE